MNVEYGYFSLWEFIWNLELQFNQLRFRICLFRIINFLFSAFLVMFKHMSMACKYIIAIIVHTIIAFL